MKKLFACAAGMFLGATVAAAAYAQEAGSPYVNAGFQRLSVDAITGNVDGMSFSVPSSDHNALVLRGGYDFETYLGAEAEIVWGLGSESVTVSGGGATVPVEISVDRAFGVFGKAQFPIAEGIGIHGRLGFVSAEAEASATVAGTRTSVEVSDDALAYGVGFEIGVGEGLGVRFDWTQYDFDEGWDGLALVGVARF